MLRYEVLMLVTPEVTQDEAANLEKHLTGLVKDAKADLISYDRWGKYRLAYPVRKKDYGVYCLLRFGAEKGQAETLLKELQSTLQVRFNDLVMRFVFDKLHNEQSLEYIRPQSLEEVPQDAEAFLKENPGMTARQSQEEASHDQES